jgi:hypothetical protein
MKKRNEIDSRIYPELSSNPADPMLTTEDSDQS